MSAAPGERARKLGDQIAETVRKLNHLTLDPATLTPPEVYRVTQDLRIGVERMPQLVRQLGRNLSNSANRAYSDRGDEYTAADIAATLDHLDMADELLARAARLLAGAAEAAAHLGYRGAA